MISNKDLAIDKLKGILVILMILSHIYEYKFFPIKFISNFLTTYINLITFSGFMFCFGYVCYISYINKNIKTNQLRKKLLSNFFKLLIVYYISSIMYLLLVDNNFSIQSILKIILFIKLGMFSEFLLSFAFIYIFILLFYPFFKHINNNKIILLIIISLLSSFIYIPSCNYHLIGVFFSIKKIFSFPIIQYSSFFLIGIYFAKNNIIYNNKIMLISIIGTISYMLYFAINHNLPSRFPPSLFWITGSFFFIYINYLFCKKDKNKNTVLELIGNNSLLCLLISNIIIFITKRISIIFNIQNYNLIINFFLILLCFITIKLFSQKVK